MSHETPGLPPFQQSPLCCGWTGFGPLSQQAAPLHVTGREKRCRRSNTSKAREEMKDVVRRANSSQWRAPPLCGFFTASSRPGRIAHHISTAGKTQTAKVSTLSESKQKHFTVTGGDHRHYDTYHMDKLYQITNKSYMAVWKPTTISKIKMIDDKLGMMKIKTLRVNCKLRDITLCQKHSTY